MARDKHCITYEKMDHIVCKPDTLWNFLKNAPDPMTLGRVCFALANRESELNPSLTPLERTFHKMIVESAEWMCNAIQKKHEYYKNAKKKKDVEKLEKLDSKNSTENLESKNSSRKISSFLPSILPSNNNISGGGGNMRACANNSKLTISNGNTSAISYPKNFKEVKAYLSSVNLEPLDEEILFAKFMDLKQKKWVDGRNRPIKDWREFFARMVQKQMGAAL